MIFIIRPPSRWPCCQPMDLQLSRWKYRFDVPYDQWTIASYIATSHSNLCLIAFDSIKQLPSLVSSTAPTFKNHLPAILFKIHCWLNLVRLLRFIRVVSTCEPSRSSTWSASTASTWHRVEKNNDELKWKWSGGHDCCSEFAGSLIVFKKTNDMLTWNCKKWNLR